MIQIQQYFLSVLYATYNLLPHTPSYHIQQKPLQYIFTYDRRILIIILHKFTYFLTKHLKIPPPIKMQLSQIDVISQRTS
jgi:hypothetical protein